MFWVELTFKGYEDAMIFCVSIFYFLFRTNGNGTTGWKQLPSLFLYFFQKYHSETICSQLCSKFFRNNYKAFWQRHLKRYITVVEDFTDMHHHMNQFFLEWISLNDNWWRCLKNYHLHNNPSLLFEEHCTETFHLLLLHASFSLK